MGWASRSSLDVDGLTPLASYDFRVLAVNDAGPGAASNRRHGRAPRRAVGAALAGRGADERVGPGPSDLGGADVERRVGGHRLHRPALTERHHRLGDDQRRRQHQHRLHRRRAGQRHPLLLPGLRPQRRRQQPCQQRRQRHPAHPAERRPFIDGGDRRDRHAPADVAGPVVERRVGGHRLHRPALAQRHHRLDDDQRRRQHQHRLHRQRTRQRHPLLLPGLRPQRRRQQPDEQRRQRRPRPGADGRPLVDGGADEPVRARFV